MEISSLFFVLTTSMVLVLPTRTAVVPSLTASSYEYPLAAIAVEPTHHVQLAAYQENYSPYVLYNVVEMNAGLKPVPAAVFTHGKPMVQHIPAYNYGYYGTPIYDFRLPLQPVYPVLRPTHPPLPVPKPPASPAPTPSPPEEEDGGIETLDQKVDPEAEKQKPVNSDEALIDDDTVAVEAI